MLDLDPCDVLAAWACGISSSQELTVVLPSGRAVRLGELRAWVSARRGTPPLGRCADPEPPAIAATTGAFLRRARLDRGFTQEEVARRAGVSQGHVSAVERGAPDGASKMVVQRIAVAVNADLDVRHNHSGLVELRAGKQ